MRIIRSSLYLGLFAPMVLPAFPLQEVLPASPQQPSIEDCRVLNGQYYAHLKELYDENRECMKSPVDIGPATSCSGGTVRLAWPACQPIAWRICRTEEARGREYTLCMNRARQVADDRKAEEERRGGIDGLKKANDVRENLNKAYSALTNPVEFLQRSISSRSLLTQLLGGNTPNATLNEPMTKELYRYAKAYTDVGLKATASPLIRGIQSTALNEVGEYLKTTLSHIDELRSEMAKISSDLQSRSPAQRNPSSVPDTPPRNDHNRSECDVFRDEAASRDLMQRNNAEWLALYRRCQQ